MFWWEWNGRLITQSLVAPSDSKINEAVKNRPLLEIYVQEQTGAKRRKTKVPPAFNINNSLTVNDAIGALSNSKKWAGADIFICPPDSNCSFEDSPDEEDPQLRNLSLGQLLIQYELQIVTTDTDEMVAIDQVENLEMMSWSEKMSLLPSNVNCCVKSKNSNEKQKDLKKKIEIFSPRRNLEIDRLDRENHNWNHVRTFELFFDNELIGFWINWFYRTNDKCICNWNKCSWLGANWQKWYSLLSRNFDA